MITSAGNLEECSGKWIVNVFGKAESESFEISVIRKDYKHGRLSYGWFDDNKLLITHNGGPCMQPLTKEIWGKQIILAHEIADLYNREERLK